MPLTITAIVCAFNEAAYLGPCLHSLLAQTRPPDEIVVVDNASTDATDALARAVPGVRVLEQPRRGLVWSRELGRHYASGAVLAYLDADCRAPIDWLARVERRLVKRPALVALSGPYRFYDWHWQGRLLARAYDWTLAPATQLLVYHLLRRGTLFYGGNFAVRRDALQARVPVRRQQRLSQADAPVIRGRRCCDLRSLGRRFDGRWWRTSTLH
jgi:glycosyltransferase involved in cell wall biosynthesis